MSAPSDQVTGELTQDSTLRFSGRTLSRVQEDLVCTLLLGGSLVISFSMHALVVRAFGLGIRSDAFFTGLAVVGVLNATCAALTEMFVPHYHGMRTQSRDDAERFYSNALWIAAGVGASAFLVLHLWLLLFDRLGWNPIPTSTYREASTFLRAASLVVALAPVLSVNALLLQAEHRFTVGSTLQLVVPLTVVLTAFGFGSAVGLGDLGLALSGGSLLTALLQFRYVSRRLGLSVRTWSATHPLSGLIRESLFARFGQTAWLAKDFVTIRLLAGEPAGTTTAFFLAARLIDGGFSLINFANASLFGARVSSLLALGRMAEVRHLLHQACVWAFGGVALVFVALWLTGEPLVTLLAGRPDPVVRFFAFALAGFAAIVCLEQPFLRIVMATGRGGLVAVTGTGFLVSYAVLASLLKERLPLAGVPFALALTELALAALYCVRAAAIVGERRQ